MAKNPRKPVGVCDGPVDKLGAYGVRRSAQISETRDDISDLEEPDSGLKKPVQTEQMVPRSPAWPENRQRGRDWASPSYSAATGRAAGFGYSGERQMPDAGDSTVRHTDNRKGRGRPGRW